MKELGLQNFVVKIGRGAPDSVVQNISRTLVQLDDASAGEPDYGGFEIAAVSVESYVSKRFADIADNVYVHSALPAEQLQLLLREQLGSDYKYCTVTPISR